MFSEARNFEKDGKRDYDPRENRKPTVGCLVFRVCIRFSLKNEILCVVEVTASLRPEGDSIASVIFITCLGRTNHPRSDAHGVSFLPRLILSLLRDVCQLILFHNSSLQGLQVLLSPLTPHIEDVGKNQQVLHVEIDWGRRGYDWRGYSQLSVEHRSVSACCEHALLS